jgi:2-methylcitrate dehydratase PrpD
MHDPALISERLAQFVAETRYTDLPARTIQMSKRCLLDAIGVSLAASGLGEGCETFAQLAVAQGGKPTCTILGSRRKVPPEAAAFANGSMAHAMDYEDAHDATLLHPNAAAVPAALAIAEAFGPIAGEEVITAIAVGCDVAVRLGLALRASLSDFGWYPPPILAAFGATAAAAKLLRLTAPQVRDAFSLTLCQAVCSGEIKYSPNSVVRAVRDAFAARAAVTSALLAQGGISGFDQPFEGRAGFFQMFARGAYEPRAITSELGEKFEIEQISFKPWPSCRGTHAAIQGCLELRSRRGFQLDQVAGISIRGSRILQMLDEPHPTKRKPRTAIDAKFSLPFTCATALVRGQVTLAEFLPQALAAEDVLGMADRVTLEVDQAAHEHAIGCSVTLTLRNGESAQVEIKNPLGHPENPMSQEAIVDKFVDCARYARAPLSIEAARRIADATLSLETSRDVGKEFMPLLQSGR